MLQKTIRQQKESTDTVRISRLAQMLGHGDRREETMKMEVSVLKAMEKSAAKGDNRPVLAGIAVQKGSLVTTDGFTLAVYQNIEGAEEFEGTIFPLKKLLQFAKSQPRAKSIIFRRDGDQIEMRVCDETGASDIGFVPAPVIVGRFPDASQILGEEKEPTGAKVLLDARYLRNVCDLTIAATPQGYVPRVQVRIQVNPYEAIEFRADSLKGTDPITCALLPLPCEDDVERENASALGIVMPIVRSDTAEV